MPNDNPTPTTDRAGHVCSTAELGPLPDPVAMIGNDGHPRHIGHVWGVGETRLYGPPRGLYRADQMRDYARAAVAAARERCAKAAEAEDVAPTDDPIGVQECIAAAIRRA